MKRVGNLYNQMLTRHTMEEAFRGVMKDKKQKDNPNSLSFMMKNNKEYYIADAADILSRRAFKPRKPREAYRYDKGSGKLRHIQAPILYPDQLIHWVLMTVLREPVFLKGMDHWCCASVKGRGILYAKNFLEKKLDNSLNDRKSISVEKQYKYCLKMDIRKFFEHIDRGILMKKLESRIKDKEILHLCSQIIYSIPGTGLPLGYYTSQWFANFYLQEFDHYLREVLMPKYGVDTYIRYMDDMIILGSNKRKLERLMNEISEFLATLSLELKNTSCIFDISTRDIDFIGYRFSYGKATLRKGILHRGLSSNQNLYKGKFTLKKLRSASAYNGWFKSADTREYQNRYFEGSRKLEAAKMKEALAEERLNKMNSKKYIQLQKIENDIVNLRDETENDDGKVLIRYYGNSEEVRVVARTHYTFPEDLEENKVTSIEIDKKTKKKRRRRNASNTSYYPSAEIYFSDMDKADCIKAYNSNIIQNESLVSTV